MTANTHTHIVASSSLISIDKSISRRNVVHNTRRDRLPSALYSTARINKKSQIRLKKSVAKRTCLFGCDVAKSWKRNLMTFCTGVLGSHS